MDKITRRYLVQLGILIIGSFVIKLLGSVLPQGIYFSINYALVMIMLFAFGFSLNNQKKKSKNYSFRHLIIVILLVLLYFFDTNIVSIRMYHLLLSYTVADGIIIKLLYVYLGWLFSER